MRMAMGLRWGLLIAVFTATQMARAQGPAQPVALGDANAKVGGSINVRLGTYPKSLNPYIGSDVYSSLVDSLCHPSLASTDMETRESVPYVAKGWSLSPDNLVLTVQLDERAKWLDDTPIAADDVIYSWTTLFDPKINAAESRAYLDGIEPPEKVDDRTIKFKFKRVHWNNLNRVFGVQILQKSAYGVAGKDFNKDFQDKKHCAGPYVVDEKKTQKNRKIVLRREAKWWGFGLPANKGIYNFDTINLVVYNDDRVAIEALKKGDLSWLQFESAMMEAWVKETNTPEFKGNPLVKLTYPRANPVDSAGIVLNMRQGPLAELKFREALQLLFNRKNFVEKLYYGLQEPLKGPFGNFSPYSSPKIQALGFDPAKAASLLKELGYTKADSDGVLFREVAGKKERASITVFYAYQPHEKYLTVFKEDARKVGLEIAPRYMEWAPMMKLVDERKFDAVTMGWQGSPEPNPEQLWLGKFADEAGSSNIPGFKIAEADKLIEEGGAALDTAKRYPIYQKLEELIVGQHPYIWRWSQKEHYFVYNKNKVAIPAKNWKFAGNAYRDAPWLYWWDASLKQVN